jgi:hypothetical protein
MRTFLIGAVVAVGLCLAVAPQQASAHWTHRSVQQWDPVLGAYVVVRQRVWVPDVTVVPAPVVVAPPMVYATPAPVIVERHRWVRPVPVPFPVIRAGVVIRP